MTDLFLQVLNASFAASWVVLAIVLARLLLKKAPRWMVCGLWALVAVRLIFGGIEAPFSLLPSDQIIPPESQYALSPTIHSGISSIDNAINPVYSEALRANPTASVNPLQVWLAVFANLWILGVGAMAVWAAASWFRVRREVRESIPAGGGVFLCDRIVSPFIFGLFRPKIYLPSDLSGESRVHVIAHEKAHLARRDHWWKPLGFALLTINWFNPVFWLAYILLCRDIEMACDEKVVRDYGVEEKKAYSAALLRCSVNPRRIAACPLAFGEVGVKQRVKSVLNYKKPAFWIILAAVVLAILLAASLLTNPLSPDAEIRWDGVLYIQDGRAVKELPADAESVGTLRSVLHDEIVESGHSHPNENSQSVHLTWEYAGQPLYLTDGTLYIEKPGSNGWLPFVPKHSPEDVLDLLDHTVQINLSLEGGDLSISEFIADFGSKKNELPLRDALASETLQMTPSLEWDQLMLAINYADNISFVITPRDYACQCTLVRRETDWLMVYRDEDWAVSAWTFESPELDAFVAPWQKELDDSATLFAPFTTAEAPIYLEYRTVTMENIALRLGIPNSNFGSEYTRRYWEWKANVSYTDRTAQIQCRPSGREDWLEIRYNDHEDAQHDYDGMHQEPITLANRATGTLCHSGDPARWELIVLDTTRGQLLIHTNGRGWAAEDYQIALSVLGTLSVEDGGTSLLGNPPPSTVEDHITLQTEDVTNQGLRLVYTHQSGSEDWAQINTGSEWTLERFENETWVNIMPEDIYWTAIAESVPLNGTISWDISFESIFGSLEAGLYRIGKSFYAYRTPNDIDSTTQPVELTCSAEFQINPLGITLSVENITPDGATLVCTQDGTPWDRIITGAPWHLERYEDGQWISVMPEYTVWTSVAYLLTPGTTTHWNLNWNLIAGTLEPGHYRVSKTFTGERTPMFPLGLEKTEYSQTCYAEFIIE